MATSATTQIQEQPANPFAALQASINQSRLGSAAINRNLLQRVNLERSRAAGGLGSSRNTVAPERFDAQVAPVEAVTQTPAPQKEAVAVVKSQGSSFASLVRRTPMASVSPITKTSPEPASGVAQPTSAAKSSMFSRGGSSAPVAAKTNAADGVAPVKRGMFALASAAEELDPADFGFTDDIDDSAKTRAAEIAEKKKSLVYSDEMMAVVNCNDPLILVDAFAGCGKTTTAVAFTDKRPDERTLYMCLNKANADEASQRFGKHVTCATTHSVAWKAMKPDKTRITTRWKPVLLMDQLKLQSPRDAMITMRILADFFNSADVSISEKHADAVAYERDLKAEEISNCVAFATLAWKRMLDPKDKLQMPHDAYLKMFALKAPKLPYDRIVFDEAQDANPVTLQIINGQKQCKILCIGDRHQSIYQFRGSVNAMEKLSVGATHLHLSQTWRFGPKVAEVANLILSELKSELVPIKGMGTDGDWSDKQVTVLSRTNAELFRLAAPVRGEGVHWVGGVENYRLDQVMDAFHLFIRERSLVKDELMRRKFLSWEEFVKYGEDANDGEAKVLTKVVEEFANDIPALVDDIKRNAVANSSDATLTLTTAHRAKGLDWDYVRISDDFEVLAQAENIASNHPGADMPIQDINLLYVAVTRAKKAVQLNTETLEWIKNLPKHRSDREAAATRLIGQMNQHRESVSRP